MRERPLGRRNVLIVDSERLMRWYLGQLATDAGCSVIEADDCSRAVSIIRDATARIDCMILNCLRTHADLTMVTAIREIRPGCRIVLTTQFRSDAFAERALALGVDYVVAKPIAADDARLIIQAILAHPALADAAPQPCSFGTPRTIRRVRETMFGRLAEAGDEPGSLGRAAKAAEHLMKTHAENEDQFGLSTLGLLPLLASGVAWPEMKPAVAMASALHSNLPQMLDEHAELVSALEQLECVARRNNRHDLAQLAQAWVHHVESETEVLYPAAIVAGRYLDAQLTRKNGQ